MALKVFRFDASGCNGCDIEILSAILNPEYAIMGVEIADSPEDAGAMIVTGGCNEKTAALLKDAYVKLQDPKLVIAMGACASSMCVFKDGYQMRGPVDAVVPVHHFVLGCPPRPQSLAMAIHALLGDPEPHTAHVWAPPEGLRARMSLDTQRCTACGACAAMCPSHAIDIIPEEGRFRMIYNLWKCSFCGTCEHVCPEQAVRMTTDYSLGGGDKLTQTVTGDMPRSRCATCGAPHITPVQAKAITGRIFEHAPGFVAVEHAIQRSLGECHSCKTAPGTHFKLRKDVQKWAYGPL